MDNRSRLRTTKRQLETLVSFLEGNKELAENRKFSPNEATSAQEKWQLLQEKLNSLDGPKRNIKEWKQVFSNLKTNTRRRARAKKYDVNGTGGGAATEKPLTDLEERILNIINPVVIDGVPNVEEPGLALNEVAVNSDLMEENTNDVISESEEVKSTQDEPTASTTKRVPRKRKLSIPLQSPDSINKFVKSQEELAAAIRTLAESIRYMQLINYNK